MKAAGLDLLQSRRKPAKPFSDFNTLQLVCVMGIVVFVLLVFSLVGRVSLSRSSCG